MNFRRVVTALAVLALFAGLASAQVIQPQAITCSVAAAAPTVRTEGLAERVGDIVLTCTGGPQPTANGAVDRATITVDYGAPITSKTDGGCAGTSAGCSEALLLIDEPNTVAAVPAPVTQGYGAANPAISGVCSTPNELASAAACVAYAEVVSSGGVQYWVMTQNAAAATPGPAPGNPAAFNAYQGQNGTGSSGNGITNTKVVFYYVPILAPYSTNVTRVYRITNVRVNATGLSAGATLTPTITIAPAAGAATTLSLASNNPTVATAQSSLTTSVTAVGGVSLCVSGQLNPSASQGKANVALITFTEKVANAFKPRNLALSTVPPAASTIYDSESGGANQNPGGVLGGVTGSFVLGTGTNQVTYSSYNSESGNVVSMGPTSITGGLASSWTRLKAVFANLDPKATYYVSLNPVIDYNTSMTPPTVGAGDQSQIPWAVLLTNGIQTPQGSGTSTGQETATFTGAGALAATAAGSIANPTLNPNTVTQVQVAPLLKTGSTSTGAEAVWEVTNKTPGTITSLTFAIFAVYANTSGNSPTVGNTATVTLGYAATTANSGTASSFIPRFSAPSGSSAFFNVVPCQTVLLFPYVTNYGAPNGYETGIAIANTSMDPFQTPQSVCTATGACQCTMNFYGTTGLAPTYTPTTKSQTFVDYGSQSATISAGTQISNTLTLLTGLSNFNGYAIAVCNFQFAHGFAFVETSKQTLGMGYLALVMQGNTRGQSLVGESFTQ